MTITSGFFNSIGDDRVYEASFFAKYFATFIGNGIFVNPSTNLQVYSNDNMTTKVVAGTGWINGWVVFNDSHHILTHDRADGVLKRIDRVVMRLDHQERLINIVIKKGTFASQPVAPSLQRDGDAYELALADVLINNGVTQITQANITDQRLNKSVCGIVHGTVDQVDTTTIFNQYQAWFNEMSEIKLQEIEDFQEALETSITQWMQQEQDDFNAWFASIQDILDENIAATLASRMTLLENNVQTHENTDIIHGRFTMGGKRYQGQWLPTADLQGLKFVYTEVN